MSEGVGYLGLLNKKDYNKGEGVFRCRWIY